ncbi:MULTISPECIES: ABC transporter ATP-binding protein [Rhodococcus]|uniref:ABC transporter ATP-binding protein n=1 Tax=Rhodococcus TaxID=1827 RepID=UPI0003062F89|nr:MULTISPECIES: ABC transporter ATP-binding protein [Rhodococcus]AHK28507.1 Fe(3+) ions import ATP-binding protein FbpC [Rhodococcus opacus PD630]KXF54150.1 ABC transporter ATP-binding protein [Rhodococcus sp. SC4]KXX63217.1 ABC transporter ATP-binding protein [Rhodococcus sp. LB1]UDG98382.1 ABC transporter ATP-binding protein [Rhodococcus opacus PD630]
MTSQFRVSNLTKTFGSNTIVDQLDLDIEDGEFLVLLGPSGCGKTTTLRCIAGLETPEGGSITFKDHTVFDASTRVNVPAYKRNIGMVFQSYALWPNMTVRENIRYPLKVRRMKSAIAAGQIETAAGMVDCGALLDRYPSQLSGGQQQRVAVARGLVAQPDLVLFDEPLSNLDARLRDQVRSQIHQLHQRLGFTAVFVTHDQAEAFALGDRLAIMKAGRIEQYDTPERVYESPSSDYVAAFIGMANRLELVRRHEGWTTRAGTPVDLDAAGVQGGHISGDAAVGRMRPDDLALRRSLDEVAPGDVGLAGELVTSEYGGRHFDVTVNAGGERLYLRADAAQHGPWLRGAATGSPLVVSFSPTALRVFPHPDGHVDLQVPVLAQATARSEA